ncbi:hypothetical protein AB0M29_24125 [Streptomyces sp. NPDC051976]|uniref:hypothetical protein n=1 Tax=Streptomyces sp. NPDC051976 TaxID=3154947 RepID=UPI003443FF1F
MSDRDLSEYERMWTRERDLWVLFRSDTGYLPILKGSPPMAKVICDQELEELVVSRMIAAGVAVVADLGDCQAVG